MSTKFDLLFEQIYYKYITGEVDVPRIPSDSDIYNILNQEEFNETDPTFMIEKFTELKFKPLHDAVQSIVNDVDILYQAVDTQSRNILDQLTNSIREYRGVKFSLDRIKSEADDINSGKSDVDHIRYVHTENFTSLKNINTEISSIDVDTKFPVVDLEAAQMYIPDNYLNLVDLQHYYGQRLDFRPTNYTGSLKGKPTFIGSADAATILDINNDGRLTYQVQTDNPTEMNISFTIQLAANGEKKSINAFALLLDSEMTKGYFRPQYLTDKGWLELPIEYIKEESSTKTYSAPVVPILADKLQVKFKTIETTHLKFIFMKEKPDDTKNNYFNVSISKLAIFKSSTHKISTLISNSTQIKPYGNENPVISTIASTIDGHIPEDCFIDVYVAQDKLIPAYYINSLGAYVDPKSLNATALVPADNTTPKSQYTLLSDIKGRTSISGVANYNNIDYDWKLIKSYSEDNIRPEMINFIDVNRKDPFDNSLSSSRRLLFGDPVYNQLISGTYPQDDYPFPLDSWFTSGCIEPSNPYYNPWYIDAINSGILLSGFCWGDPTGFPWAYYDNVKKRTIHFNDLSYLIPGWDRPDSELVTPEGIVNSDGEISELDLNLITNPLPDFHINGIKFYKVYKFQRNSEVIASDMNIYTYQTKPVNGVVTSGVNDYYPHNMVWNYNDKLIPNSTTYITPVNQTVSGVVYLPLPDGSTYINNSVRDVQYYDDNYFLDEIRHYRVRGATTSGVIVDMTPLQGDEIELDKARISYTYSYNTVNEYLSYWDGYIIVDEDEGSTINIIQKQYQGKNIVERVKIINTNTQEPITNSENDNYIYFGDQPKQEYKLNRGIYSFRVHCLTDRVGSYPANWWSPNSSEFIEVVGNARIVADVNPMKIVSLETLLYTTTYENDYRAAIITDIDGLQYVVVKEPSKNIVPGYYFDDSKNSYTKYEDHQIKNIGHYKRRFIRPSGVANEEVYITGSKQNVVVSGIYTDDSTYEINYSWNKGKLYPSDFSNTTDNLYRQHSTFGFPINVDETEEINRGHLFYNTAENLPAFYTIEYGLVDRDDSTIDKFLYKIDLKSEHEEFTPILNSIKFNINTQLEEL